MASKVMTFRLPEVLAEEIVARTRQTGKDKTAIVVEALTQAFGLPLPLPAPITIDTVQKQLDYLQSTVADLTQQLASNRQAPHFSERAFQPIVGLEQAISSFQKSNGAASLDIEDIDNTQDSFAEERRQFIRQIEQQAKTLDQIFSSSPDVIYVSDRIGRYIYVNPTFTRVLGLDRSHLLGKLCRDLTEELDLPSESIKHITAQFRSVFISGQSASGEISLPTVFGTRAYEYILTPIFGGDDSIHSVVCTARDITERKQAEIDLRESEAKYRNLFESANDSIFIIDASTKRILNANWNAARRLGYTRQELLQISINEIELPMDEVRSEAIQRELQLKGNIIFEHSHRCKDGTEMPVEISSRSIEYEGRLAYLCFVRDITERKQAEAEIRALNSGLEQRVLERTAELSFANEALRDSEAKLRHAQRVAHVGSWELDVVTQSIVWTDELYRIFELDPAEYEPNYETCLQRIHPDDREMADQIIQRSLTQGIPYQFDHRILLPDGSVKYIEASGETVLDAQGQVVRLLGTARDITDRRQTELALQESELLFRSLFEQAAIGIAFCQPDGKLLRVNQKYCDITGYAEAELLFHPFEEITYPADRSRNLDGFHRMIKGEIPYFCMDKRYVRKDGSIVWTNVLTSIIRSAEGAPKLIAKLIQDIHDRKQAEAALQQSEQLFRMIIEHAAIGITRANASGQFLQVNQRFCEIVGYTEAELLQMTFQDITHPEDLEANRKYSRQLWAGEISTFSLEKRYIRKDGQAVWVEVNGSLVRNLEGTPEYSIGTVEDISDRKSP